MEHDGASRPTQRWARALVERAELVMALLAAALTAILTRHGPLLDPDSPSYLFTARLLRDHPSRLVDLPTDTSLSIRGLFPPAYPVVLALGGGGTTAARIAGIALAALAAWTAVRLVGRLVGRGRAMAAVAVLLVSRGHLLVLYGFVMSDGLHVVLLLAGLTLVVAALDAPALRWRPLLGLTAVAAAIVLSRYVGIGTVVGLAAALVAFGRAPARRRLVAAATILAGAAAALFAWTALLASTGGSGSRTIGYQPLTWGDVRPLLQFPLTAFLPRPVLDAVGSDATTVLGALLVAALGAWSFAVLRRAARATAPLAVRAAAASLLVGAAYTAALVSARVTFDRMIPLDGRYAMPMLVTVVLAITLDTGAREPLPDRRRLPRATPSAVATVAVLAVLVGSVSLVRALAQPGEAWSNLGQLPPSPLARYGATRPEGVVLVTNREDIVFVETGRTTRLLAAPIDFYTGRADPAYATNLERLARSTRAGRTVLLVFTDQPGAVEDPSTIARRTGLRMRRFADGAALEP